MYLNNQISMLNASDISLCLVSSNLTSTGFLVLQHDFYGKNYSSSILAKRGFCVFASKIINK